MVASSTFKQELLLREYGINVHNLVKYILTLDDRAHRTRAAQLLVNLMARLNPSIGSVQDAQQKLWNHLFVMADGQLDVDAPFELSAMEYLNDKPQRVEIPTKVPKFKHYGKNVEALVQKVSEIENEDERRAGIIALGKLMKALYKAYNKDTVSDEVILSEMKILSQGKLNIELTGGETSTLFDVSPGIQQQKTYSQKEPQQQQHKHKKHGQHQQHRPKHKNQ
ncbi:DUF4290 domain-containing protein [Adhaeribacter soli]|uniref:DUF4290 domain-containing protein n=1 Tax=Adhaeribacter soli TaxID=2607655 RepID=A0A5N1J3Y8_9BACT|nr:DUF4290 domain-containing protein [Adhaeribacter soli]